MSDAQRLTVLHLFESYLRHTENWCYRLISNLPDTEVVVASTRFLPNNFFSPDFRYLPSPVQMIDCGLERAWVRLFNRIARAGQRLYPHYLAAAANDVVVMHSHYSVTGWKYLQLARRLRVPHIVSFYGFDYEYLPFTQPVWRERYHRLFAEADMFICEGKQGAELLATIGCPRHKIRVARLGVEVNTIPVMPRHKKPQELTLLQIASITEKKGHRDTIAAFLEALRTCPNMTLCLVGSEPSTGSGVLHSELLDRVRDAGAADRVQFVPSIPFARLHEYFRGFQVFIHPSRHTREHDSEGGAPVVLLDAQATGMPIIATRHCDIPDEVIHNETGLLAEEGDIAGLVAAIVRFYNMTQVEFDAWAARARAHVERSYDIRQNARRVRELYEELARPRPGRMG